MLTREQPQGGGNKLTWTLSPTDKEGESVALPNGSVRTIQARVFVGEGLSVFGSNDNESWFVLHDDMGAELHFSSHALATIHEAPQFIRVVGSGTAILFTR